MKAFFSATDEKTVEKYASDNALWSVVTNHADALRVAAGKSPTEMYIRVDCFDTDNPKRHDSPRRYTIENCGWGVGTVQTVPDSWFVEQIAKTRAYPVRQLAHLQRPAGRHPYLHHPDLAGWPGISDPRDTTFRVGPRADHLRPATPSTNRLSTTLLSRTLPVEPTTDRYDGYREVNSTDAGLLHVEDDGPDGLDNLGPFIFSHPYITGLYRYGTLDRREAWEISGDYERGYVTEKELVDHLDQLWDEDACTNRWLDQQDRLNARLGMGPTESDDGDALSNPTQLEDEED